MLLEEEIFRGGQSGDICRGGPVKKTTLYLNIFTKEKLQIVSGNAVIRRMSEEDGGQTDTEETKVG